MDNCKKLNHWGEVCHAEAMCDECIEVETQWQYEEAMAAQRSKPPSDLEREGMQDSHKACDRYAGGYYDA